MRQSLSARKWAGLSRYNTEPPQRYNTGRSERSEPPQQSSEAEKSKPSQLALIRDDIIAGLPSDHSLFGPNVQLCDEVVFNAKAALWMQGVQDCSPSSPSSQTGVSLYGDDTEKTMMSEATDKSERNNTFMYE